MSPPNASYKVMAADAATRTRTDEAPVRLVRLVPITERERRAAVVRCYEEHYPSLVRLAYLLGADRPTAEDVVHDAFVRLFADSARLADPAKALAYLRTSVVNHVRGKHRRNLVARKHEPAPPVPLASAEDAALGGVHRGAVVAALQALPERQRACLVLRHYLGMTEGEIATTLGVSVGSVRTHVRRGMAGLERRLGALR
jgi:RNA polymerase sigma-70 factor (sigma-E family)